MPDLIAYMAPRIFTGETWLEDQAIIVKHNHVKAIVHQSELPEGFKKVNYPDCFIAPAFIDIQIYGAQEKLFSQYPGTDALAKLREYCAGGGTTLFLPTLATNTSEVFYRSIDAVREYWQREGKGVFGVHLEGPWLNPSKRGAHIESLIHPPELKEVQELLEYGKGVIRMITLAPEVCSQEIIDLILAHNILISAGHSNAAYTEAMSAFSNGISAVTHLFNAMSPLQHRAPGLAGAAMDSKKVMASIIPDGYHVDYAAIRIAKKAMSERLFVITDAVTGTQSGPYLHALSGEKYETGGILSGSALTMNRAVANLVRQVDLSVGEALRMCSLYPARALKLDNKLGKIEPGYEARFVILKDNMEVEDMID